MVRAKKIEADWALPKLCWNAEQSLGDSGHEHGSPLCEASLTYKLQTSGQRPLCPGGKRDYEEALTDKFFVTMQSVGHDQPQANNSCAAKWPSRHQRAVSRSYRNIYYNIFSSLQ